MRKYVLVMLLGFLCSSAYAEEYAKKEESKEIFTKEYRDMLQTKEKRETASQSDLDWYKHKQYLFTIDRSNRN